MIEIAINLTGSRMVVAAVLRVSGEGSPARRRAEAYTERQNRYHRQRGVPDEHSNAETDVGSEMAHGSPSSLPFQETDLASEGVPFLSLAVLQSSGELVDTSLRALARGG